MHLLKQPVIGLHIDELRREHDRDARGGRDNVAKQLERARSAGRGDGAHVPDHGALRVEVGGDHQKPPPLSILARDLDEHLVVDVAFDQFAHPAALDQAAAEQRPKGAAFLDQALRFAVGVDAFELRIIVRSGPDTVDVSLSHA
jgi:hypothetical protein